MLKSPNVIRYPQYISFKFQIFLYPKISIDWRETSFEVMFTLYKYLHICSIYTYQEKNSALESAKADYYVWCRFFHQSNECRFTYLHIHICIIID